MTYTLPLVLILTEEEVITKIKLSANSIIDQGACLDSGAYSADKYNCDTGAVTGYNYNDSCQPHWSYN